MKIKINNFIIPISEIHLVRQTISPNYITILIKSSQNEEFSKILESGFCDSVMFNDLILVSQCTFISTFYDEENNQYIILGEEENYV